MTDDEPLDDDHSTLLAESFRAPSHRAGRYRLKVVDGPARGRVFEVDGAQPARFLVGEGPACAMRLDDRLVSRRHAAFEASNAWLKVTDLGSKNGTFVNGVRTIEACLFGGEIVKIGATSIRVEAAGAPIEVPLTNEIRFGRVIGRSPAMRKLYPLLARLAKTDVPLVIEGETGTGKELLAESIHEESERAQGPFVVFDCTAVAPNLVESALFGHEKGAFTGASSTRRGVFELAHGGTLLIDEIGDLEPALQSKLLRAIERGEVQRVGSETWLKVDVRVLAATRRDLDAEVQARRFRDDLFFRLAVARVELPPLRAREGDVAMLARHFWRELGGEAEPMPSDFVERLESYGWPGNVRELYNAIARRVALGELAGEHPRKELPKGPGDLVDQVIAENLPFVRARDRVLAEFERRYVERALERFGGNVSRAAAAAGIARRYFHMIKARSTHRHTE